MSLTFNNNKLKPTEISTKFRSYKIPVIGYIKGNKFHIDLKAIPIDQINLLVESIKTCLK